MHGQPSQDLFTEINNICFKTNSSKSGTFLCHHIPITALYFLDAELIKIAREYSRLSKNLTFLNCVDELTLLPWCPYVINVKGKMPFFIDVTLAKFFANLVLYIP